MGKMGDCYELIRKIHRQVIIGLRIRKALNQAMLII